MKKAIFILLLTVAATTAWSQKKVLIENKDQIIEQARLEIEQALTPPEGPIYLFVQEHSIKGEYTYDITIREKGDVATVFSVGNMNGTIEGQNKLKDFLLNFEFSFKVPKGKYYKFRHIFSL
jgi:hypothetical protein